MWKFFLLSLPCAMTFTVHPTAMGPMIQGRYDTKRFGFFDNWLFKNDNENIQNEDNSTQKNDFSKGLNEVDLLSLNNEDMSILKEKDSQNTVIKETDFIQELEKRKLAKEKKEKNMKTIIMDEEPQSEFDGYALRDAIFTKWGCCYDLEFQKVETFGFRNVYLNVMPFKLGGRRFRHRTELDYLMHLQAIVEILEKYKQLDYVLSQIETTDKTPRGNTSPLVAVPLRLDLSESELNSILNNRGF